MDFTIQSPNMAGRSLLDALVEAADGADRGGGVFAFASARGISMLIDDHSIRELCTSGGTYSLVVGVDAITDQRALDLLHERSKALSGLNPQVLIHGLPTLFHPKFCWFGSKDVLTLIVGSGNLTSGGLVSNIEAFSVTSLEAPDSTVVEDQLMSWLSQIEPNLFDPDSPEAKEQAASNSGSEVAIRRKMAPEEDDTHEQPPEDPSYDALVAEITKNAPKRTQVDIGQEFFISFFGGAADQEKRIVIQHVAPGGVLGEIEPPRALFETKSHNYRFEAKGRGAKDYPEEGRPIGVFVRGPDSIFRYTLVWPGEDGHGELDAFLTSREGPSGVRRHATDLQSVLEAWPDMPRGHDAA